MWPQEGSCVLVTALRLEELMYISLRSAPTRATHTLGTPLATCVLLRLVRLAVLPLLYCHCCGCTDAVAVVLSLLAQ